MTAPHTPAEAVQYWYDAATERREERDRLRAVVARVRQMADYWEQRLPETIRTPAVVSALRAALDRTPAVPLPPVDQAALREIVADALATAEGWRFAPGFKRVSPTWQGFLRQADAVLAVLPAPAGCLTPDYADGPCHCPSCDPAAHPAVPADRRAVLREAADRAEIVALRLRLKHDYGAANGAYEVMKGLRRLAAVLPATTRHDTDTSALLPAWEAVYEPGNVSNYLIGYANDPDPATAMAEAWLRSQAEVTGRLEWVDDKQMATGRYDRWFELIERHDGGVDTGPGIIVRRRVADETAATETEVQR